jgi:4-amino-4-deoxychorismate lyase
MPGAAAFAFDGIAYHSMSVISDGLPTVIINGENTRFLDSADRGLHYGDGVFTTLSVLEGKPIFLARHLARLQADAGRLSVPFPGYSVLTDEAKRISGLHPESVLKITLTQGAGGRGYRRPEHNQGTCIMSAYPKPNYPESITDTGVQARVCEMRLGLNPRLAGNKHLNRLEQVLARAEWSDENIREGLMLDYEGFLIEGVMSNVFLVRDGVLLTPLLDRCGVSGVMRGLVLDAARDLGLQVEQARILPEEAMNADELFLTNSIIGLWPVCLLDGKKIPLGRITRLLSRRIARMTASDLASQKAGLPSDAAT